MRRARFISVCRQTRWVAVVTLGTALTSPLVPVAANPVRGTCEVRVLDGTSREVKVYAPGNQPVEFAITGVRGWTKCRMSHLKKFKLDGNEALRVDLHCFGSSGQAVNASAVAVTDPLRPWAVAGITIIDLLAPPVAFHKQGTDEESVTVGGYKTITLDCLG